LSEHALRFGDQNALSGILTEAAAPSTGTGVAILSAGITHRVGPNRLHVSLARDLRPIKFWVACLHGTPGRHAVMAEKSAFESALDGLVVRMPTPEYR
jgi:hypothetical protein